MNKKELIIFIMAIGTILCSIYFIISSLILVFNNRHKVEPIDTTYNHIVLDSIKYNIIRKDSIIYKLRIKYEDEIKKVNAACDTAVVKQFKQLASEE